MIRLAIAVWFAFCMAAYAGDTSRLHSAHFTVDGGAFVLIEEGVSDGLGAPYVNVFAVNVNGDTWLDGFPVRDGMDEEEVRKFEEANGDNYPAAARAMKSAVMDRVMSSPKVTAILSGARPTGWRFSQSPWDLSGPERTARFVIRDLLPSSGKAWRVDLVERDFPAGERCYGYTQVMKGYRLTLTNEVSGETKILNDDTRIPKSRGCPLGYGIANVASHRRDDGSTALAIVLRLSHPGFEGPDRRLMVVTTGIAKQ